MTNEWEEIVEKTKNHIAEHNGFDDILGNPWKSAMGFTHRKKSQIELYEAVIDALGIYFEHTEKRGLAK